MEVFDRLDPDSIERREMHLWILACAVILVLAGGVAVLVYPAAFAGVLVLTGAHLRVAFFSFCTLSILAAAYLLDRHVTIHRLRLSLAAEQRRRAMLQRQASDDLLKTLAGSDHFQDRLAMECRRASSARQPFSVVVAELKSSENSPSEAEITIAFGDAVKALSRKLRPGDSIFALRSGVFAILLPGLHNSALQAMISRLTAGLEDAAGAGQRFTFGLKVLSYPQDAKTAQEIEQAIGSFLPEELVGVES